MKKLHTLLSAALLCLVALAVSAGQRAATVADWEVITSLTIDDVVLITNAEAQKELDGIRLFGATRAGKSADYKDVPNGAFPLIVAEGIEEGTYAFITPDGKYLAWDYPTANSLNTSDVLNANSSWRVTFEDGKAVIRNVDKDSRKLQYSVAQNRFAAYTTERAAITLWHHTPETITVAPESGDISEALAKASKYKNVGDIVINLKEGVTYTVSQPIVAPQSLTVNGNGATIDAFGLEAALITTPAGDLAEWMEGSLVVKDVTVKGVKKGVYASAGKNYLYNDFLIENSVIELAGTAGRDFDFRKGGVARNFTISNSTIYAPEATKESLYTSQSAQRATEAPGVEVQTFTIKNSTLYNLAKGKNFFTHRQANQKWLAYTIENSIFVNCGKSGQVVKGINQGQQGANPTWKVKGNAFNFDGEDTSAAEATGDDSEPVQDNVAGVVAFADVEKGNFTLAYKSAQNEAKKGDPRWIVVPEDVKVTIASGDISAALEEALAKVKVVKDIRINLTNGGEYTISKSIVVPNSLYECHHRCLRTGRSYDYHAGRDS